MVSVITNGNNQFNNRTNCDFVNQAVKRIETVRLNSWGGCMQPQVSQIGRRLHLSEFKNRERQSHYNEIVTRLVEIRFTTK